MKSYFWQQLKNQPGARLLEVAIAMTILAVIMTGVSAGFSSLQPTAGAGDVECVAETIAQNQMAYVLEQPYIAPEAVYDTITPPEDFSVTAEALEYMTGNPNLEIVRVCVSYQGQEIMVVETLRSNY